MNENKRPKRPEEILAALSAEGNRIEQLTKEIDEKIVVRTKVGIARRNRGNPDSIYIPMIFK